MKPQNTRRGNTQEVVNENCHSKFNLESHRFLLSKVRSRIKYGMTPLFYEEAKPGMTTLYNNNRCVEDPQQNSLGMTPFFNNGLTARGFTLIELLVVVLIIGILAAVALPQYQKAVYKSRAMEGVLLAANLQKAVDLYILENGVPATVAYYSLTDKLSVDFPSSDRFSIDVSFDSDGEGGLEAQIYIYNMENGHYGDLWLSLTKHENENWIKKCYYLENSSAQTFCKVLESQGWGNGGTW